MQKPDQVIARDARAELEARIGIEPLESLLAERHELVQQVADLRARHGSFGTWGDLRKTELATIAQSIRARAIAETRKMTEAAIEEAAHADPRYVEFITDATRERARLTIAEDRIQAINDRIMRDQALARFVSAEAHLS